MTSMEPSNLEIKSLESDLGTAVNVKLVTAARMMYLTPLNADASRHSNSQQLHPINPKTIT
jgi:hypothetical protein